MGRRTDLLLGAAFIISGMIILSIVISSVFPQINTVCDFGLAINQNENSTMSQSTTQPINSDSINADTLEIINTNSKKIPFMNEFWKN